MDQPIPIGQIYGPPALPGAQIVHVALDAPQMQTGLRALITAALAADPDATVVGFEIGAGSDGKQFAGLVRFGSDATPDGAVAIAAAEARVTCDSSVPVSRVPATGVVNARDNPLYQAWLRLIAAINAEATGTATIYAVKAAISGAGGMVLIGVLWGDLQPA